MLLNATASELSFTPMPAATSNLPTRSSELSYDIPPTIAGLCIDTGHAFYSGMDPVQTLEKYYARLDYIHFKDINLAKYREVMGRHIRFFEASVPRALCARSGAAASIIRPSVSCSPHLGYEGYITVEQERDPRNSGGTLTDVKASRDYLAGIDF